MKLEKIPELVSFGAALGVKVTPSNVKGEPSVNIMDLEFDNFIRAAQYLQRCQEEWFGDSSYLVG